MGKYEIIADIGKARLVERLACNVAHSPMTDDIQDLCQMVYLYLLEYDNDKLQDLWDNGQITFFIARILINQYNSENSRYFRTIVKFQRRSTALQGAIPVRCDEARDYGQPYFVEYINEGNE